MKKQLPVDSTEAFEEAIANQKHQHYMLRLYVAGLTPRSNGAIETIHKICEEYLKGRYQLEVIDIYQQPEKARDDQILAAPTLIKYLPLPLRKMIGDLSQEERILVGLNLIPIDDKPPSE
jgi:circadian clock protein KaiB